MRTVFTDTQTKRLEALFELTDYPPVEARAEAARSTGLSEETVRVWFKNRRARRKRQRSGSKVKSQSPSPSTAAEKNLFTSYL
ncbi:dharma [Centropristis striata]|uniref:dharma n=1 Tax=Centropristis striata TaxID=184440 RepID=UPI0027DF267A|nr:dharma [Centropristis striata]